MRYAMGRAAEQMVTGRLVAVAVAVVLGQGGGARTGGQEALHQHSRRVRARRTADGAEAGWSKEEWPGQVYRYARARGRDGEESGEGARVRT